MSQHRAIAIPLLCGLCLCVHCLTLPLFRLPWPTATEDFFIADCLLTNLPLRAADIQSGELWRIWSAPLLHGSLWHLGFNIFGLWITGTALEKVLGWRTMLNILLIGAAAGAMGFFTSILFDPRLIPHTACIGASALLTACIGIATTLAPAERLTLWVTCIPLRIKAIFLLPLLLFIFLFEIFFTSWVTAYGAHLGGWLSGLLCGRLLRSRFTVS